MKAFVPVSPYWYTPEKETGDNPTRFMLKPLTQEQVEQVSDVTFDKGFHVPVRNYSRVLRFGVIDWENFEGKFSIEGLDKLPPSARFDLALELITKSFVGEEDLKNS